MSSLTHPSKNNENRSNRQKWLLIWL